MSPQKEAKELIMQWVFEGKELEAIQGELAQTPLASALSPEDVEFEYYAARAGRNLSHTDPAAKRLVQFIAILALLVGITITFLLPFVVGPELTRALGRYRPYGLILVVLGVTLFLRPNSAFKKTPGD